MATECIIIGYLHHLCPQRTNSRKNEGCHLARHVLWAPNWSTSLLTLNLLLRLLLRALQPMMNLGLFYEYSPLVPILWLPSPISNARCLQISFNRIQPPDIRSAYSSSALWFMYLYKGFSLLVVWGENDNDTRPFSLGRSSPFRERCEWWLSRRSNIVYIS
jgi:hypothetical protein